MAFQDDYAQAKASGRPFEVLQDAQTGEREVRYYSAEQEAQIASDRATQEAAYLRTLRRREVIAEAVRRIGEQLPGYDSVEDLERLVTLVQVGVIVDSVDPAWVEAKRIFQRHEQLRAQVVAASLQQLRDFDATDETHWAA